MRRYSLGEPHGGIGDSVFGFLLTQVYVVFALPEVFTSVLT